MSKKSRKRNKKILGLLAAGLGAAALARRGKGAVSTVGQPVGVDRVSTNNPPIGGTDHIPVAPKKVVDTAVTDVRLPPIGRMRGAGLSDAESIAAQNKRANYAKQSRINAINTAEGPPSIDNPYIGRIPRVHKRMVKSNLYKSGGRVKLAKRGLGRAFTKSKK